MRPEILVLIKLPPPNTGAAAINKVAYEALASQFNVHLLDISYKQSVDGLGKWSLTKLFQTIAFYRFYVHAIVSKNISAVYFQISPLGLAFLRDCVYVGLAKLFSVKLVIHLHGKGIQDEVLKNPLKRAMYRWAFKNEELICLSQKTVKDVESVFHGSPFVLPNCIESESEFTERIEKTYDFMFLSNLLVSKGIYSFLEAMEEVVSKFPLVSAVIIGKAADLNYSELKEEIEKRNLTPNIDFQGPVFGEQKFRFFAQSRVFVFPTLNDIWGLVVLEAFSQSVPVIASDDGAISDMVITGETGSLIEKGNVDSLTSVMIDSLQNPEDWEKMGVNGRALMKRRFSRLEFEKRLVEIMQICTS